MTPPGPGQAARLTKIEIDNYRAFRGHFELELPEGSNLLVYGENGAGKSSIFHSLADFLESPDRRFYDRTSNRTRALKHDDYRYRFNSDPSQLRLTFNGPTTAAGPTPSAVYEWSATKNDPTKPPMRTVDKGKGCLEYRSLLRMHLLPTGENEVDLFPLFIEVLFAHFRNPISAQGRTFAEEWNQIKAAFTPYTRKPPGLDQVFTSFNAGFERVVKDAFQSASSLLATFDADLASDVDITPAKYIWPPKVLSAPRVIARPSFRLLAQPDYHGFLNEARLSALAIAVYFAALKQSPARDLRLLVLDDILIGLDMANRIGVVRLIEELFHDWQIIILTYHKAWFEVLKARVEDVPWPHAWRTITLLTGRSLGAECPIVAAESGVLLKEAREHLVRGDAKAAAVYARSAWEEMLSSHCSLWHLPVVYAESRRNLNTDAFLSSIEAQLKTLRDPADHVWAFGVLDEIKHARRFILNPNAHYNPELEDEISAEIDAGIVAVEDFEILLRCVKKTDFGTKLAEPPTPSVGLMLEIAAERAESGRNTAALEALAFAFELHVGQLFREMKVTVPFGEVIDREYLLNRAGKEFYKALLPKLQPARAYLLGTVPPQKFDPTAFRSALQLLVSLQLLRVLGRRL